MTSFMSKRGIVGITGDRNNALTPFATGQPMQTEPSGPVKPEERNGRRSGQALFARTKLTP